LLAVTLHAEKFRARCWRTILAAAVLPALLSASVAGAQPPSAAEQSDPTLPPEPCTSLPGQGPEMVLIEGGTFLMGSPEGDDEAADDERPAHQVTVRPFAIARCETTVAEFREFVRDTGYVTVAERGTGCFRIDSDTGAFLRRSDANWESPGFRQIDNHPVVCVSRNDAMAYARWLGLRTGTRYRLPTEAEWEYAARAGTRSRRFWGDDADRGCGFANGADLSAKARFPDWSTMDCHDGFVLPAPAGSYRRNAFGLSDMIGNVWEWVEDCWHDSYKAAPTNGGAWLGEDARDCAGRVVRGGAWNYRPSGLRSANRFRRGAGDTSANVGFRLVRDISN
jgi:formylglycine-generating enzyme required for sulfatase activity